MARDKGKKVSTQAGPSSHPTPKRRRARSKSPSPDPEPPAANPFERYATRPYKHPLTFDVAFFEHEPATTGQFREIADRGLACLLGNHAPIYPRLVREFYTYLRKDTTLGYFTTTVDRREFRFGAHFIAQALGYTYRETVPAFTDEVANMDLDAMARVFKPDLARTDHLRRSDLDPSLWFIDLVLSNVCYGHKDERKNNWLRCLYSFLIGAPLNVPKIIIREMDRFWTGPTKVATPLPFGHVVTRLLDLCTADFRGHRYHIPQVEEKDASLDYYDRSRWNRSVRPMLARRRAATGAPAVPPPPVAADFHFGSLSIRLW